MSWQIISGPDFVNEVGGYDGVIWRWRLRDEGDNNRVTTWVKISGTAMAFSDPSMPPEVHAVKETKGRSEVEKIRLWPVPPHTVEVSTVGIIYDGGERPEGDDPEAERELREIQDWFMRRLILLRLYREPDASGWLAAMIPHAIGSGLVEAGIGPTRLEAARDAKAKQIVNEGGTAWVRDAPRAMVDEGEGKPDLEPGRSPEAVEARLSGAGTRFKWEIAFAHKAEGGFDWFVIDPDTGTMFQSGHADDWDDAKLNSILGLYPPLLEEGHDAAAGDESDPRDERGEGAA